MIEDDFFIDELLHVYEELFKVALKVENLLDKSSVERKARTIMLPVFVKNKLISEETYYELHQALLETREYIYENSLNYEYYFPDLSTIVSTNLPWYVKKLKYLELNYNLIEADFFCFLISNILHDITRVALSISHMSIEKEIHELINSSDSELRTIKVTRQLEDLTIQLSYENERSKYCRVRIKKDKKKRLLRIFGNVIGDSGALSSDGMQLLNEVILGLKEVQGLKADMPRGETGRTAILSRFINKYVVKDESRFGVSSTGKSSGEIDIKIENEIGEVISICEALNLRTSFTKSKTKIREHLEKISGYNATGLQTIFVIVFSELENFSKEWDRYVEYVTSDSIKIKSYTYLRGQKLPGFETPKIKIYKSVYSLNQKLVDIFHLFVDMN